MDSRCDEFSLPTNCNKRLGAIDSINFLLNMEMVKCIAQPILTDGPDDDDALRHQKFGTGFESGSYEPSHNAKLNEK